VTPLLTDPFEHLDERVRAAALADDPKRLELVSQDWWISYPPGEEIISRLFELHDFPQRQRPPSLVVYAPPNFGKSAIIARFQALFAGRVARMEADRDGVVFIQVPPTIDEKRLYLEILRSIGAAAPETTTARLRTMVINQLRQRRTRLLIIDEMQHALGQRASTQQLFLNTIKYISNELSLSIAGFGSTETKALVYSDEHLAQRFELIALPAWDKSRSWVVDVVRQRIALFPLRKPTVVDRAFMNLLLQLCGPTGGRMLQMLERCARAAIEDGSERLTPSLMETVALRRERLEHGI
jgi:hypothetical protein